MNGTGTNAHETVETSFDSYDPDDVTRIGMQKVCVMRGRQKKSPKSEWTMI